MSEPYRTVEISSALVDSLLRFQPKVAVVLSYAAGETSELVRRLRELDEPAAEYYDYDWLFTSSRVVTPNCLLGIFRNTY